jgi:hypothetical protein
VSLNTSPSSSYLTFASGGYIIKISPIAIGIFVVPLLNEFQNGATSGNKYPENTPRNIARKIHNVKYLSKKFKRFVRFAIIHFHLLKKFFA